MLTVGSLFSGIGGLDCGLERAGMTVKFQVEIDPYAQKVLRKNWPDVPCYEDVRRVHATNTGPSHQIVRWYSCPRCLPRVDVLCGGFPCQDISNAGKRAGINGSRSGLWSEYHRLINEIRPSWVIIENVPALRSRGLGRVLSDLSASGYSAEWSCIPAARVGAPHARDRIWIVAYPDSTRLEKRVFEFTRQERQALERSDLSADTWASESGVLRVAYGVSNRVDRIRCLGNAVVPQVAELVGRLVLRAHLDNSTQSGV